MTKNNIKFSAIIMAAGHGTRMNSTTPKVLHCIQGIPMVCTIVLKLMKLNPLPEQIIINVGKNLIPIKENMEKFVANTTRIEYITCEQALGTGHAIQCAYNQLSNMCPDSRILILPADVPLLKVATLQNYCDNLNTYTKLMTVELNDPAQNGRIITENDKFYKITEYKDCNDKEKLIKLINCGIYIIKTNLLVKYLPQLNNNNAQKEFYLTDILELIRINESCDIDMQIMNDSYEFLNINTPGELQIANRVFDHTLLI
jgi:bifunctional UDP-N-acetylglucosamine pyrophosphorylase/glucosamine-1-phosphate N-acetyltransferase